MNRCFYLLIRLRPELRPKGKSQFELRTLNCRGTPDLPRDKPVVLAQARKPSHGINPWCSLKLANPEP